MAADRAVIKSVALERVKFYASQAISRYELTELMDMQTEALFQATGENLMVMIHGCLLG